MNKFCSIYVYLQQFIFENIIKDFNKIQILLPTKFIDTDLYLINNKINDVIKNLD